jgi:hypothetical protein
VVRSWQGFNPCHILESERLDHLVSDSRNRLNVVKVASLIGFYRARPESKGECGKRLPRGLAFDRIHGSGTLSNVSERASRRTRTPSESSGCRVVVSVAFARLGLDKGTAPSESGPFGQGWLGELLRVRALRRA